MHLPKKRGYVLINLAVLLAACGLLLHGYYFSSFRFLHMPGMLVFFFAACAVFGLKLVRLYLVFSNTGLPFRTHALQFFKTLLVSLLLPCKLGDVFRVYCYGYHVQNYLRSFLAVLLDRFVDTLALVCILLGMALFQSARLPWLLYMLSAFLLVVMLCYAAFPSLHAYWSSYLLHRPASQERLRYLRVLQRTNQLYLEFQKLIRGRLFILFLMSIAAWMVELFSIAHFFGENVTRYLMAAIGLADSIVQQQFILFSILLVLAIMLAGYVLRWGRRHRNA